MASRIQAVSALRAVRLAGLLVACLGYAGTGIAGEAADQRLFDAVWANDFGAVKRVVGQGADPFAQDNSGLTAVDVAVDKGYFDIAHYLLAVQDQRRDLARRQAEAAAQPAAAPEQPVVMSAPLQPAAPVVAEPTQRSARSAAPQAPAPAAAPRAPVMAVSQLPPAEETVYAADLPPLEVQPRAVAVEQPPALEPDPATTETAASEPVAADTLLKSRSDPGPTAGDRTSFAETQTSAEEDKGLMDRVTDLFKWGGDDAASNESPGSLKAEAPEGDPARQAPVQTAATEPVTTGEEPASSAAAQEPAASVPTDEPSAATTADQPTIAASKPGSVTAETPVEDGPGLLDQIEALFKPDGDDAARGAPETASDPTPAEPVAESQESSPTAAVTEPKAETMTGEPASAMTGDQPTTAATATVSEPAPAAEAPAEDGPGLLDQIGALFKPDGGDAAQAATETAPEPARAEPVAEPQEPSPSGAVTEPKAATLTEAPAPAATADQPSTATTAFEPEETVAAAPKEDGPGLFDQITEFFKQDRDGTNQVGQETAAKPAPAEPELTGTPVDTAAADPVPETVPAPTGVAPPAAAVPPAAPAAPAAPAPETASGGSPDFPGTGDILGKVGRFLSLDWEEDTELSAQEEEAAVAAAQPIDEQAAAPSAVSPETRPEPEPEPKRVELDPLSDSETVASGELAAELSTEEREIALAPAAEPKCLSGKFMSKRSIV